MPSGAERRALAARGNRLKAGLRIGNQGITDNLVAELQQMFESSDLIKVRVDAEDRREVDVAANELCERVPCVLIKRIGRVILLYRPAEEHSS